MRLVVPRRGPTPNALPSSTAPRRSFFGTASNRRQHGRDRRRGRRVEDDGLSPFPQQGRAVCRRHHRAVSAHHRRRLGAHAGTAAGGGAARLRAQDDGDPVCAGHHRAASYRGGGKPAVSRTGAAVLPQRPRGLHRDACRLFRAPRRDAGTLKVRNPRRAAEEFLELLRGYAHLRVLLGLERAPTARETEERIDGAVRHILALR